MLKKFSLLRSLDKLVFALSFIITISILFWFISYSRFGFDFTDESYYLISISNPFQYNASVSVFGFLYHPIFKIVSGDVAMLRALIFLISFMLAVSLFLTNFYLIGISSNLKKSYCVVLSSGLATIIIMNYSLGILTPSYNTLNFQGLMLTSLGVFISGASKKYSNIIGAVFIGLGGVVVFLAKPTSAIPLALVVSIVLFTDSKQASIRSLFIAAFFALFLLSTAAIAIDGSVSTFWKRYETGLALSKSLGGGHDVTSIFSFYHIMIGVLLIVVVCAYRFGGFIYQQRIALNYFSNRHIILLFYLSSLPYIYAFGSNNGFSVMAPQVSIFWLLASTNFLIPFLARYDLKYFLVILTLLVQSLSLHSAHNIIMKPYRQIDPLVDLNGQITFENAGGVLFVSEEIEAYTRVASNVSQKAGFKYGTPIIDLTGHSPGILYVIGGQNIGQPWLVGGYSGSSNFVELALQSVPCAKLSSSWLLIEEDGPRAIDTKVLSSVGANFNTDYKLAAKWQTARGVAGYNDRRMQALYMPINVSKVSNSCSALRKN